MPARGRARRVPGPRAGLGLDVPRAGGPPATLITSRSRASGHDGVRRGTAARTASSGGPQQIPGVRDPAAVLRGPQRGADRDQPQAGHALSRLASGLELMRAVVTEGVGAIARRRACRAAPPAPGQVVLRPEAVGICGSDYHFISGELSERPAVAVPPRPGSRGGGTIVAVGPAAAPSCGADSASPCGRCAHAVHCYPCRVGRPNTCDNFSLIGIHSDGGLQELLTIDRNRSFPSGRGPWRVAAMAEPVSIAVRAVNRAASRPASGWSCSAPARSVSALCLVAPSGAPRYWWWICRGPAGAQRSELGRRHLVWRSTEEAVPALRAWAGPAGPPVVDRRHGGTAGGPRDGRHGGLRRPGGSGRDVRRGGLAADRQPDREGARHSGR